MAVLAKGWVVPTSIVMLSMYTQVPLDRTIALMVLGYAILLVGIPLTRKYATNGVTSLVAGT